MNRLIAIHTYDHDTPEEASIKCLLLRAYFICSLPVSRAIHSKFFLPCKFCAVLL